MIGMTGPHPNNPRRNARPDVGLVAAAGPPVLCDRPVIQFLPSDHVPPMPATRRATRRPGRPVDHDLHTRRRAEILDAAALLFAAHGYAGADTQQLADAAGIAKGTVFRYFPTKRALFVATVERALERMHAAVAAAADAVDDPLAKLRGALAAYLAFFDARPETVELLILERAELGAPSSAYFARGARNSVAEDRWTRIIAALVADGRFRRLAPDRVLAFLGEVVYGAVLTRHFSGRRARLADRAGELFDLVCHGLLGSDRPAAVRRRSRPRVGAPRRATGGAR